MTREECDEVLADLERAGVRVERVEHQPYPREEEWQIVCWSERIHCFYTITNARLFRETVGEGLILCRSRVL